MMNLLEIKDLHTYFEGNGTIVKAVDGADLSIREREVVGLVGESGSGKTTIANSLLRILPETGRIVSGGIIFKGINIRELSEKEMQFKIRGNEISMIFQDPMVSLNPLFTVGEQITSVLKLHQDIGQKEAKTKAIDLFRKVRIADPEKRFDNYPHELSGGMIQRVTIAMAMSCEPSLIIADEPTTALDVTIANQILNEFEELIGEIGVSVLWITHDLGVIKRICDYVNVMYAGTLMEQGTVKTVFENPLHPYTFGLLRSNVIYYEPKGKIPTIMGELSEIPHQGCKFYPRCPIGDEGCLQESIELRKIDENHSIRCIKPEDAQRLSQSKNHGFQGVY